MCIISNARVTIKTGHTVEPLYIKDLCLLSQLYSIEIEVCCWGLNGPNTHCQYEALPQSKNYCDIGAQQCSQIFIGEVCPIVVVHSSHSSQDALSDQEFLEHPCMGWSARGCDQSPAGRGVVQHLLVRIHIKRFSGICRAQDAPLIIRNLSKRA